MEQRAAKPYTETPLGADRRIIFDDAREPFNET
jgi:hypothetical protein